eukprot:m.453594 g.453594  ORF g.453594 m.453594 type:complete len:208 (-) comp21551_c0_seq3:420-1043(-)
MNALAEQCVSLVVHSRENYSDRDTSCQFTVLLSPRAVSALAPHGGHTTKMHPSSNVHKCTYGFLLQVRQRQLLYTAVGTEPHSSLEDLYSRCERAHPTMLVIQTDDHRVFGAYCSHPWCGAVGLGSTTRAMVLCGCGNLVKDICVLVCFRPIGGSSVSSHWCCGAVCYALHCRTHVQMRSVGHSGTAMVGSTLAMRHALCGTHAMGA